MEIYARSTVNVTTIYCRTIIDRSSSGGGSDETKASISTKIGINGITADNLVVADGLGGLKDTGINYLFLTMD